jgi:hypothetical protein
MSEHPFLIADTPRAGRLNHRTIVPVDIAVDDETIRDFVARARSTAWKDHTHAADYVAVSRKAKQMGSEARDGTEWLILAGLDTARLTGAELASMQEKLSARMPDLERLVQKKIDWQAKDATDHLILRRRELNEWSEEFSCLPVPNQRSQKPHRPVPSTARFCSMFSRRHLLLLVFVLTATVAIGASVLKHRDAGKGVQKHSKANITPTPKTAEREEERRVLGDLAKKWDNMSIEELEVQLWVAIGKPKTSFASGDLYKQSEVNALLTALKSSAGNPNRFVLIGTDLNRKQLEAFDSCLPSTNIVNERIFLKKLNSSFLELRDACETASVSLPSTPLPFLELAIQSRTKTESAMPRRNKLLVDDTEAAQVSTLRIYTLTDAEMAARVMGWLNCEAAEAVGIKLSKPNGSFSGVNWTVINDALGSERDKPGNEKLGAIYTALGRLISVARKPPGQSP